MPTKLIRLPNTSPKKQKHASRRQRKIKPRELDLDHLAHEMINQLTVIQLSCFKLRGAAAQRLTRSETDGIERVEKAVADMTLLVDMMRSGSQVSPKSARDPASNVYHLFDPTPGPR